MKRLVVPYLKYQITPDGVRPIAYAYRPVIRVVLSKGKGEVPFCALVDSGADETTFPGWVAEALGIEIYRGKQRVFKGIGGSNVGYEQVLEILVEETFRFRCNAYFSNEWDDMPFGILGERSFFSRFSIEFNYPRNLEIVGRQKKN